MTSDCLLISVFLPVFAWCDHKIVLQIKTKQFYDHIMQKLVKTGKNTEINKQSDVKFWLNWIEYGAVYYSLSCMISGIWFWWNFYDNLNCTTPCCNSSFFSLYTCVDFVHNSNKKGALFHEHFLSWKKIFPNSLKKRLGAWSGD